MAAEALEDRMTALENELAQMQIRQQLAAEKPQAGPAGWERI